MPWRRRAPEGVARLEALANHATGAHPPAEGQGKQCRHLVTEIAPRPSAQVEGIVPDPRRRLEEVVVVAEHELLHKGVRRVRRRSRS